MFWYMLLQFKSAIPLKINICLQGAMSENSFAMIRFMPYYCELEQYSLR